MLKARKSKLFLLFLRCTVNRLLIVHHQCHQAPKSLYPHALFALFWRFRFFGFYVRILLPQTVLTVEAPP